MNESSNLLRKFFVSEIFIRIVLLTFMLVGDAHYYHQHGRIPHQNSLSDGVVHGFEDIDSPDRRASSVQSLQRMFSTHTSSTSKSYPRLQPYFSRQASSPTTPFSSHTTLTYSTCKNASLSPTVHRLNHYRSRHISFSKTRTPDESILFVNTRSSDECVIPAKELTTINVLSLDYDNELKKSEPVEIRVRCIFSRVGEIDTLNERYTAEIFFEASWYDQDHKIGAKYDPQMGHFNPQLVVLNHIGDSLRHEVNK